MPFRDAFECLWCGAAWSTRGPDDLEGFAQLCPDCVGRAGDNGFLRFRLKAALDERARAMAHAGHAQPSEPVESVSSTPSRVVAPGELATEMIAYYQARAGEYDDWYLRRGRYERGPVHDQAWVAELDVATLWLDSLGWSGEIVELAAGTGWWSPLLATKGELSIYDAAEAPLDRARDRLLAHRLRAHIHVRDAWLEPDRAVDGLFCGFWLSHVPRARLAEFLALTRRWLRPGGMLAFIDSRSDSESGALDQPGTSAAEPAPELDRRRLADGREFRVVKVYYEPDELRDALLASGFASAEVTATPRFFLLGRATA
ncbi:MAG: class I SAM-dependent methyltransferase [Chloroflexota bacterium]|nr:class I SAM-dependent methyltransferase [Chloroflexota bacterium]